MTQERTAPPSRHGAQIDWNGICSRMDAVQAVLDRDILLSTKEKCAILKARALVLAQEQARGGPTEGGVEVIEFRLASETYAVEPAFVREIWPLKDFTPLPGTPPFVLGIVNVRGQILSVIDLKKFFHLPEKGLSEMNNVIIIRNDRMEFGLLADAVLGTFQVSLSALQSPPPTVTGTGAEYLKGVTAERVIVLDTLKILSDEKIVVNEEVGKSGGI